MANISTRASDTWRRCRKRNYAMSIERLLDAVERRGDIGRRVAALVLPISNRPRVTSRCARKIGLREPGEHTSGPNLATRDNVAHNPTLYMILETPPPVTPAFGHMSCFRWLLDVIPRSLLFLPPPLSARSQLRLLRDSPLHHPQSRLVTRDSAHKCR